MKVDHKIHNNLIEKIIYNRSTKSYEAYIETYDSFLRTPYLCAVLKHFEKDVWDRCNHRIFHATIENLIQEEYPNFFVKESIEIASKIRTKCISKKKRISYNEFMKIKDTCIKDYVLNNSMKKKNIK